MSKRQGGVERRKGGRRPDISQAGTYRLLKMGAEFQGIHRVSNQASKQAVTDLQDVLAELGRKLLHLLEIAKRKTVTVPMITMACEEMGLPRAVYIASGIKSTRTDRSALSGPGLIRQLGLGKMRMSGPAKQKLVGVAEAYVKHMGTVSGCVAGNARRKTVKQRDLSCAKS